MDLIHRKFNNAFLIDSDHGWGIVGPSTMRKCTGHASCAAGDDVSEVVKLTRGERTILWPALCDEPVGSQKPVFLRQFSGRAKVVPKWREAARRKCKVCET